MLRIYEGYEELVLKESGAKEPPVSIYGVNAALMRKGPPKPFLKNPKSLRKSG